MYGLASLASNFSSYELIASCIFLIVVNVQTGTPSNPSEALEKVVVVVVVVVEGLILADTDDAVEEAIEAGADFTV